MKTGIIFEYICCYNNLFQKKMCKIIIDFV